MRFAKRKGKFPLLILVIIIGVLIGWIFSPIQQATNIINTKSGMKGELLSFDGIKLILNNAWTGSDIQCEKTEPNYDFAVVNMSIINQDSREISLSHEAEIKVEQGYIYDKHYSQYCRTLGSFYNLDPGLMVTDNIIFKIVKGTKPVELKIILHPDYANYDNTLTAIIKLNCIRAYESWIC